MGACGGDSNAYADPDTGDACTPYTFTVGKALSAVGTDTTDYLWESVLGKMLTPASTWVTASGIRTDVNAWSGNVISNNTLQKAWYANKFCSEDNDGSVNRPVASSAYVLATMDEASIGKVLKSMTVTSGGAYSAIWYDIQVGEVVKKADGSSIESITCPVGSVYRNNDCSTLKSNLEFYTCNAAPSVTCSVPIIPAGVGSWTGTNCESGANNVAVGTTCTITAASGYQCSSPGECLTNGAFEAFENHGCIGCTDEDAADSNEGCVGYVIEEAPTTTQAATTQAPTTQAPTTTQAATTTQHKLAETRVPQR